MKCPYCAEEIKDEAIKCKHCASVVGDKAAFFKDDSRTVAQGIKKTERDQIVYNFLVIGSLVLGVIAGIVVGSKFGSAPGWISGALVTVAFSAWSAHGYFKK